MGEGVDPTQMCQSLVDKVAQSKQLMAITDPDLLVLFEDWFEELEDEIISLAGTYGPLNEEELAKRIGLSLRGSTFLLSKLRREGKLCTRGICEIVLSHLSSDWQKGLTMNNKKTTFAAILAVLITIGSLWFTNRAVTPKQATWDDVLVEGKNGGYQIITTEELAKRYQEGSRQPFPGRHPPGVGIQDRASQRGGEFSHGTDRLGQMAQGIGA